MKPALLLVSILGAFACAHLQARLPIEPIEQTEYGRYTFVSNELLIDSVVDDPPALRLGAPRDALGNSLGKLSGDVIDLATGRRDERVLLQFKRDERTGDGGEVTLHIKVPGQDGDAAYAKVVTFQHDRVIYHVPVYGEAQP